MNVAVLVGFIIACEAVGLLGSVPNIRAIPTWYATLRRPSWTPPSRVFAPVWTTLYLLMGVAAWRHWLITGFGTWAVLFSVQLGLNLAWSWIFFGLKQIGLALIEMTLLWAAILWCLLEMRSIDPLAGWLLGPYLLWVSYALSLNAGIWALNRRGHLNQPP